MCVIYKDHTGNFMLTTTSVPESSDTQNPVTKVWVLLGGKWRCSLTWWSPSLSSGCFILLNLPNAAERQRLWGKGHLLLCDWKPAFLFT